MKGHSKGLIILMLLFLFFIFNCAAEDTIIYLDPGNNDISFDFINLGNSRINELTGHFTNIGDFPIWITAPPVWLLSSGVDLFDTVTIPITINVDPAAPDLYFIAGSNMAT